ncbi:MAG: hypothetical protein HOG45_00525 [Deltaproteobacteria bacterium]|nr:hypothetical protein [Deltaproteobacteria bacterium]
MNNPENINRFKNYAPVKLEFLTPVSVGDGDTMDPMRYTIVKEGNNWIFHLLNIQQWLMDESQDESLMNILENADYREVRREIQTRFDPNKSGKENLQKYSLAHLPLAANSTIPQKFTDELNNPGSSDSLLIDTALRSSATHRMLIPGSSIKGAIRTAVIDWLDMEHDLQLKNSRKIDFALNDLLGQISENDFRALQINDFELPHEASILVNAVEKRLKEKRRESTPKNTREASGALVFDARQAVFSCSSAALGSFKKSPQTLTIQQRRDGSPKTEIFDWSRLCRTVSDFYRKRFDDELEKFYRQPHLSATGTLLKPVCERIAKINPDSEMLLRVGHYSHIESMTITNVDPEKQTTYRQGKKFYPGTTRTLADGRVPFGWCIMSLTSENDLKEWRFALSEDAADSGNRTFALLKTPEQKKAVAEAEQAQKLAEAQTEQLRIEEENRLQYLESLTPLELLLEKLHEDPDYKASFGKLDDFEDEEQLKLAEFFKEKFKKENQWEVKAAKKKKQFQKVQKLKQILGE